MAIVKKLLTAVVAVMGLAVVVYGVSIYLSQRKMLADPRANQPQPKKRPKSQPVVAKSESRSKPAAVKKSSSGPKATGEKETAPPPALEGEPESGKQYTLAEAEAAMEMARSRGKQNPQYLEVLSQWQTMLADPSFTQSSDYSEHIEKLKALTSQMPESPTPWTAMAKATLLAAWRERGDGPDAMVSEERRQRFREQAAVARQLIDEAIARRVPDSEAYAVALEAARIEGLPLAETRRLFEEGRKVDGRHSDLYAAMAEYLLPQWHGKPGDVERFAAEMAHEIGGDEGLCVYLYVAYAVSQYDSNLLFWGNFDRQLLARAAEATAKQLPHTRNVVPFAALCTIVAQDRETARRIRPLVKYNDAPRVWLWEHVSKDFFQWCDADPQNLERVEYLWGAALNYPNLAFSDDSKGLWCATGVGPLAVTRWDLADKKAEVVMTTGGRRIGQLAIDLDKSRVAATLNGEKAAGWLLWDTTQPEREPYFHTTSEACEAVAIDPAQPRLAFAAGHEVRLMDLETKAEGPPILAGEWVRGIRFSRDGKSLAIWGRRISVWDTATGEKRYSLLSGDEAASGVGLPAAPEEAQPVIVCEKVLDFDSEGHVYAVGFVQGSRPVKRSLVRYAADGKTWEAIVSDLQTDGPVQALTAVLSPDQKFLAASVEIKQPGDDEAIRVWNLATGKSQLFSGHHNHIGDFAFSPDGQRLASVSQAGGPVKVWNLNW